MKKRRLLIPGFVVMILMWALSPALSAPLSLDENIKAIVAARANLQEGFDFVVTGDNRDGREVYNRILNRVRNLHPLFILHTGDLVATGRPVEYEEYAQQIASCDVPIVYVPGNHDVRSGANAYRKYVGEPNWYFDLNGIRIIGLDNATGVFSADTVAFARKTLTSEKICVVAFHMPPPVRRWSVHAMVGDRNKAHWGEVMDLIKGAKAPVVFLGHIHLFDEMDIDGTAYIISGGGGAPLYGQYHFGKPEYGFVVVRVRPGGITHEWIPLN
ncbi:MAG TPA: metallophosphoesterase [Syntrophorhabdaceae bacterium]|nr:metallophosphoesterase [Syntrophorhabdaceae bacterium]